MTSFQKKVYEAVKRVPRGKVLTYKQVARLAGKPRAYRAVGSILSKNKDPKVPCHRVIGSNGGPGGYNKGVDKKTFLLRKEGVKI
ncbi:Methylated-DNA--protein-cysteine methyltransferase [subsurface metagenome]